MQNVLAVSALLLAALPCAAADAAEWGQTVDGLRMSVAVVSDSRSDPQVRVTVNYVGDKPLLLPFAFISDTRIASYRLRLFLLASDGQHSFDLVPIFLLAGRLDPLVIPMVPQASYVLELPITAWRTGRVDVEHLGALIKRQGQLWAELDCGHVGTTAIPSLTCPLYGYPNPNQIVCWEGKLTSNKVTLPK
jgi:hypothetical protein